MAQEKQLQNNNISQFNGGLHTDNSLVDSPKGTYRFALNSVNETELGDFGFISNEESNEQCASLTTGYIPIGKCYIGDNETVIFSVSADNSISEIGILDNNCNYTPVVNDVDSILEDKLNFKIEKQIQATYRLRKGCEKTIYFTDNLNKPRYFNFNKLSNFKNSDGTTWNSSKFNLQKTYEKIPIFEKLDVLDSGGNLEAGSYNVAIQYVDENLNATEWITVSNIIKIYNDLSNKSYNEINGSINSAVDYLNYPKTSKAIKVNFEPSSLDKDFLYYRLAIIESNNGSGIVSKVIYTENIPTTKSFYIYTGSNGVSYGSEEEILQFTNIIEKAGSIEQIENRLILGNITGNQTDFCKLQKYASKIKADCVTKTVILNDVDDLSNPKNPLQNINGLGYMPGEIYSFGIVYLFEDNTTSPTYHIPGRNPSLSKTTTFTQGNNIYPMASNNISKNSIYTPGQSCVENEDYWGVDSEGQSLTNKFIRHHRFPLRTEINKPLVEDSLSLEQSQTLYQLQLKIVGQLKVPYPCEDSETNCTHDNLPSFDVRVSYKVDGQNFFFVQSINPANFSNGTTQSYNIELYQNSQYHSSNNITDIVIEETDINGNYTPQYNQWSTYFLSQPTYTTEVTNSVNTVQGKTFKTKILGIKFSGVDIPSIEDTNGKKVVGYFIVRNERTEFDKTILDTGVLIPSIVNEKYISHGLLQPETDKISSKVYGVIHPEHKFLNKEYVTYDKIIQQGNFNVVDRKYGKINFDDVYDGSSFNKGKQKEGNDDGHTSDGSPTSRGYDGWSLNIISRDNILSFDSKKDFEIDSANIKDRFYLDALGNKSINDNANDVYNIACDNKIGMISLDEDTTLPNNTKLPYVAFYKENADPYSNFRILPYYKENVNPIFFNNSSSEVSIFNGDTYVSSMRYVNTVFWDNRVAKRAGKTNALKKIVGAFLVVLGAILVGTGIGAPAGTLIIGAGVAVVGAGALFVSSALKQDNFNKAYNEEYDKGLRQTTLDNWVNTFYNYTADVPNYFPVPWAEQVKHASKHARSGPSDDTIQWIGDCLTDLWFESSINTNLRHHFVNDTTPTYLDSPGRIENGNNTPIALWEFFDLHYANSNWQRYPISSLERHLTRKLLAFDQTRDDNKYYIGVALGEYYEINPDYLRLNKQKIYYHLPLEYDCCSDCKEKFPHRVHYSEQSYQEEITDNYRILLPNNYRDIEGETGEIVNIFRLHNNLYIHTKEALWILPRNYQERVTDQIISFVGTGSYFEIPPQKILDSDTGASAGTQHKWSSIKTPAGYFFVSENQRKIYQFNGENLEPISSYGISNWFENNIEVQLDKNFYNEKGYAYPNKDNPSNLLGTGFITTYDTKKERVIFSKKDYSLKDSIYNADTQVCSQGGNVTIFPNFSNIISSQASIGWKYEGLENCKLKFSKKLIKTRLEPREVVTTISNDADVIIHLDMSGSFNPTTRTQIKNAVGQWLSTYNTSNPNWTGRVFFSEQEGYTSQRCWRVLRFIKDGLNIKDISGNAVSANTLSKNIVAVSFVNENLIRGYGSNICYHPELTNPMGMYASDFIDDYTDFKNLYNSHKSSGGTFHALNYPINYSTEISYMTQGFMQHVLAVLKGVSYTQAEVDALIPNPFMSADAWNTLKASLLGNNIYPDDGLENYGWKGITNRGWNGSGDVITAEQFQVDMNQFLQGITTTETIMVEVEYIDTEYSYIEGETVEQPIKLNNSWTISYSLKNKNWVSWHSYLPNFYIDIPEKFYSWKHGNSYLWKHGKIGHYQTYYNEYKPHIIEYTSLSNPISTRIWNYLLLQTEAKSYDYDLKQYNDERDITFNKAILYNTRQCSGEMDLIVKDLELGGENYMLNQIINTNSNQSVIDRKERDWFINDFRDIRIDYSKPIWNSNPSSLQSEYYIDKILNTSTLDINKDWTQLESFRDKYLVVRLIFDKFANKKLITNFSVENEQQSFY